MNKKDLFLIVTALIVLTVGTISALCIETAETIIPAVVTIICLGYLGLFAYANNGFHRGGNKR